MNTFPVSLDRVRYNPETQSFEALATVEDPARPGRYPCAIRASIDMNLDHARIGLERIALQMHQGQDEAPEQPLDDRHDLHYPIGSTAFPL